MGLDFLSSQWLNIVANKSSNLWPALAIPKLIAMACGGKQ